MIVTTTPNVEGGDHAVLWDRRWEAIMGANIVRDYGQHN